MGVAAYFLEELLDDGFDVGLGDLVDQGIDALAQCVPCETLELSAGPVLRSLCCHELRQLEGRHVDTHGLAERLGGCDCLL